jgi:TonB family protein
MTGNLPTREIFVVVPQSKPLRSGKIPNPLDRDFSPGSSWSGSLSANPDESTALSSLKDIVAAGDQRLDPMLRTITEAAQQLTGASGAALAMWKDGAMVCRARSGDTAPALGARLSVETGISGECLRTGKIQHCADTENDPLVDLEVCRSLSLRSIAVLPIQGWRGVNGILEVFSTTPAAFSEQHIAVLQQLAALAERARASQPHGASSAARKLPAAIEKPQSSGLLPASDRVGDVALAFIGHRSRPFVLGALGLVALSLLGLVIWLGWRGADDADGKAHAAAPAFANASASSVVTAHPPDNDRVWRADPGGEPLFASSGKPSAGSPVKFASKVDMIAGSKNQRRDQSQAKHSPLLDDLADKVATSANSAHSPETSTAQPVSGPADLRSDLHLDETTVAESPSLPTGSANQSAVNNVLSAKASLPGLSAPVSQGVSGGQLVRRVPPVYPAQARLLRLEGKVTLAAMVMEDGTVRDVKVVDGPPVFVQPAMDAVKLWRYKPFQLDGKPVKNEIAISIDFTIPTDGH